MAQHAEAWISSEGIELHAENRNADDVPNAIGPIEVLPSDHRHRT